MVDQAATRTLDQRLSVHSARKPSDAVDQRSGVQDNSKLSQTQNLIPEKVDGNLWNPVDPKNGVEDNPILHPALNSISEKVDEGLGNPVDPKNGVGDNPKLHPTLNLTSGKIDEGLWNPTASRTLKRQFSVRSSSKLRELVRDDVEKPLSHQKRRKDIQTEERSRRSQADLDNLVSPSADSDVSQSVRNSG